MTKPEIISCKNISSSERQLVCALIIIMRRYGVDDLTISDAELLEASKVQPPLGLTMSGEGDHIRIRVINEGNSDA